MAQALLFINGELINRKVTAEDGLVDRLVKAGKSDAEILNELYWTAFGRPPRPAERDSDLRSLHRALAASDAPSTAAPPSQNAVPAVQQGQTPAPVPNPNIARRRVFEDLLWALVNSKEFLFNH